MMSSEPACADAVVKATHPRQPEQRNSGETPDEVKARLDSAAALLADELAQHTDADKSGLTGMSEADIAIDVGGQGSGTNFEVTEREQSAWRIRWGQIPLKIRILSLSLFFGGASLLILGLVCSFACHHSLGMLILGGILILPGTYSLFILVNFCRGKRGYHWGQLPATQ
eukprot:NODE_6927_length_807_cov_98.295322_g6691_i0.p1 GENE.NODE_6927_length_807_cov_98.295322_g6691_i0~~NODE_6927_length_807_cov_98.295322_g6691_i0.p1  ORF type:complete len:170 (-),score=12.94 NODE_6927_length_807_cov_98.295322_g6691_i0:235-744(-)